MISQNKMNLVGALVASTALITSVATSSAVAKDAYNTNLYPNNSEITLQGTVVKTYPGMFELNYAVNNLRNDIIKVEMDDWDAYDESNLIRAGEILTVYGKIDQDRNETRTIEADGVYSHTNQAYYFASKADEEDYLTSYYYIPAKVDIDTMAHGQQVDIRGLVTEVEDDEFEIQYGNKTIEVEVDEMAYNPLDDTGYQRVREGDIVYVSGDLEVGYMDDREIEADTVITLYKSVHTNS